jgi:hypothetical protein
MVGDLGNATLLLKKLDAGARFVPREVLDDAEE